MRARGSLALGALALLAMVAASGYALVPSTLTGRIVDAGGHPVAGATVTLDRGPARSTTTGPSGSFGLSATFVFPPPHLRVTAPGYLEAHTPARPAIVLHHRPLLVGRMVDETGAGIDHAVVTASVADTVFQTVTDVDGFFWLEDALAPGQAFVVASAAGHDAYRGQVDLLQDLAFQLNGTMARQLGTLVISTNPGGVAPTLDGGAVDGCPATPCSPVVSAGRHTLAINSDAYVPWSADVTVWEGARLPVTVTLQRKTGTLRVTAPAGANAVLSVDGQPVSSLSWSGILPTGPHTVAYGADDHWPAYVTANVAWNQTTSVSVASAVVTPGDQAGFQAGMSQYLASLPGQFSAWVTPLGGGPELGYQPSVNMEAASVIKVPLAIFVEKAGQDGTIKMSDQVQLEDGDFMGGTGTLDGTAQPGDKYSYGDLLALLIQQSDNTAWQALDRVLGVPQVDGFAASIGAPDCHQLDDGCTAREAGIMLQKLAMGQLLDPAHTRDLLQLLETTVFNDRINYYLGAYTIAHKVGMDGSVMNDAGVVYAAHPFVVSMFTNADPTIGVEAIRQVSRLAARLYR